MLKQTPSVHVRSCALVPLLLAGACVAGSGTETGEASSALTAPQPMSYAFDHLVDAEPSPLKIEYWKLLSSTECAARGLDESCAEVCTAEDTATSTAPQCSTRPVRATQRLGVPRATGYICLEERCVPSGLHAVPQTGETVLGIYESTTNTLTQTAQLEERPLIASSVFGVIPPVVWDWLTGTQGECCNDCWATHRSLGLPCVADNACCAATCGVDPTCGGGGGGGTGGGGGPGGGTDTGGESCGASYSVVDAPVSYMGQSCLFTGTVNPTMINDVCMQLAGEGMIICPDVSIELDEEAETETPEL